MMDERRQKSVSTERSAFVLKFALFFAFLRRVMSFVFFKLSNDCCKFFFFTSHFILFSSLFFFFFFLRLHDRHDRSSDIGE